ncbi:MAG: GNAT family N-acetyltransferase [Acidobacteria bacterium]|nr:GNAT family N-acetyltransferase [Acidobacteriota bacterium]
MARTPERMGVDYGVYAPSDAEEMARLLAVLFTERDPPAVAVGLTAAEFEAFVMLFCRKAEVEGLTIVARSAATGQMMGVLLAEDLASAPPEGMEGLSRKFDPIFAMLSQLEAEYRGGVALPSGECLHLFLLGVARDFAGQGVGRHLVEACLENGARRGYRVAVTEATNKTSQHIFRKLSFVERVGRSYGEYRFQGQAVFASIAEHGGPIMMDKLLGS